MRELIGAIIFTLITVFTITGIVQSDEKRHIVFWTIATVGTIECLALIILSAALK